MRNPCHPDTCRYRKAFFLWKIFTESSLVPLFWGTIVTCPGMGPFHPLCQGLRGPFQSVNLFSSVLQNSELFLWWLLSSILFMFGQSGLNFQWSFHSYFLLLCVFLILSSNTSIELVAVRLWFLRIVFSQGVIYSSISLHILMFCLSFVLPIWSPPSLCFPCVLVSVLVCLGYCNKNIIDRVVYKQQTFLTVLEAEVQSRRSRHQKIFCLWGIPPMFLNGCLFTVSSQGLSGVSFTRTLISSWGLHFHDPITSQWPHLPTPSPWGLELNIWIAGQGNTAFSSLWSLSFMMKAFHRWLTNGLLLSAHT